MDPLVACVALRVHIIRGVPARRVHAVPVVRGVDPRAVSRAPLVQARPGKLDRARSRLYRSQILQVNMRLKALAEIYTMHSFAQLEHC